MPDYQKEIRELRREISKLKSMVRDRENAIDLLIESEWRQEDKIRHYQNDINNYEIRINDLQEKIERLEYKLNQKENQ